MAWLHLLYASVTLYYMCIISLKDISVLNMHSLYVGRLNPCVI